MSETTRHGEGVAEQIQGSDAYGNSGDLTHADVWNILDNLHTHFLERGDMDTVFMIGKWLDELQEIDEDLPL